MTGVSTAVGDPGEPVEVGGGDGLLDELDVEAGVLEGADHPDRLAGVQPWLASSRSRTSGPTAARTARTRADVGGGVGADLQLEHRKPSATRARAGVGERRRRHRRRG